MIPGTRQTSNIQQTIHFSSWQRHSEPARRPWDAKLVDLVLLRGDQPASVEWQFTDISLQSMFAISAPEDLALWSFSKDLWGDRPEQSYKILVEYFPYSVDLGLSVHESLWSRRHWKITRILCPGCLQGCQYTAWKNPQWGLLNIIITQEAIAWHDAFCIPSFSCTTILHGSACKRHRE